MWAIYSSSMNEPFKSGIPARLHAAALGFGGGSQEIDSLIGRDLLRLCQQQLKDVNMSQLTWTFI